MLLQVDRRTLRFERDDALVERITRQAEAARETDIALAKSLLEMKQKRTYLASGCSSIEMFVGRFGYEPHEVRRLLKLGESMDAAPSIEDRIRAKALSVPAAVAIAPVLTEPALFPEKDEWVDHAQRDAYSKVRRNARRRMAELRCGEPVETIEVRVPDSVVERFERARVLASRKAARALTRDETFEAVVDAYVDANDPLLVKEGKRRVGPTEENPAGRYIPASVQREIRRRASDTCEFPGCFERGRLEFAHRRPHAGHKFGCGSGREARDLVLLCRHHHFFQELRYLVPIGQPPNMVWIDPYGLVFSEDSLGGRDPETERERRAMAAHVRGSHGRGRKPATKPDG